LYADEDAYEAEDFDGYADLDEDMDGYIHGNEGMDEYAGEAANEYMDADMRRRARGGEELGGWSEQAPAAGGNRGGRADGNRAGGNRVGGRGAKSAKSAEDGLDGWDAFGK
jgi:hypothetical protein